MNHPHSLVVVGSNEKTPAKFSTQLEPIKLNQNVGMAVKSIFHGSIKNVTVQNKKIPFMVNVTGLRGVNAEWKKDFLEIEEGNYSSTLAIIKAIGLQFKNAFASDQGFSVRKKRPRLIKPINAPFIDIDKSELDAGGNGFISITPRHMLLNVNKETPWSIFISSNTVLEEDVSFRVRNVDFTKTIQPTFLYSNIVENSYINGKLSRNLSTIPLTMNNGWNFYEFHNPTYVPIDVKEFSKIIIELRDMNGEFIKFDPAFKTIINLHIKPINTSADPTMARI